MPRRSNQGEEHCRSLLAGESDREQARSYSKPEPQPLLNTQSSPLDSSSLKA